MLIQIYINKHIKQVGNFVIKQQIFLGNPTKSLRYAHCEIKIRGV